MIKTARIIIGCFVAVFSSFYLYNALVLLFEYQSINQGILALVCALCVGQLFFLIFANLFAKEKKFSESTRKFWEMTYKKTFLTELSICIACFGGTLYFSRYLPVNLLLIFLVPFLLLVLIDIFNFLKRKRNKHQADFSVVVNGLEISKFENSRKNSIQLFQTYVQNRYKSHFFIFANINIILLVAFLIIIVWQNLFWLSYLILIWEVASIISFMKSRIKEVLRIKEKLLNGDYAEVILFIKEIYSLPYDRTIISQIFEEHLVFALYHVGEYEQCIQIFEKTVFKKIISSYATPYRILSLLELNRYEDAKNAYMQFTLLNKNGRKKNRKYVLNKFDAYFASYFAGKYEVAGKIAITFKSKKPAQKQMIQKLQNLATTRKKEHNKKESDNSVD